MAAEAAFVKPERLLRKGRSSLLVAKVDDSWLDGWLVGWLTESHAITRMTSISFHFRGSERDYYFPIYGSRCSRGNSCDVGSSRPQHSPLIRSPKVGGPGLFYKISFSFKTSAFGTILPQTEEVVNEDLLA